jgi:hypothetical protein
MVSGPNVQRAFPQKVRAEYAQITKWSIYQGKPGSCLPENAPATA